MLISLTVGKVDAGVAVLLTEDKRLIEFPSILLPPSISSGSIVDIKVSRNTASEAENQAAFSKLQEDIYATYGHRSPAAPVLRCRNATQTAVVLEWDAIELATADVRSLSLFRNGAKAGRIPRPLEQTSTKLSGLAIDQEYTFQLVLRTSAGSYSSEKLKVRTHKMTDLSGITVTPGPLPPQLKASLATAVERIGARMIDSVRIDTTHFVCIEGRGREWERAVESNIPVVRPEWIEGCEREGRIVGVRGYYLNADPRLRQVGQGVGVAGSGGASTASASQQSLPSPQSQQRQGGDTAKQAAAEAPPKESQDHGEPPIPPEKDAEQRPAGSRSGSLQNTPQINEQLAHSPSKGTPEDRSEASEADGDDGEEEEEPVTAKKADAELELPQRNKASGGTEGGDKDASDSGSMEDVAL